MKRFLIKILTLFALLSTVAWFTASPGWSPLVAFLTILVTLLGQEIRDHQSLKSKIDHARFLQLVESLPSNGCIRFLENHDFRSAFRAEEINQLRAFVSDWSVPENEFSDLKLNDLLNDLIVTAEDLCRSIGENTWQDIPGISKIPPEWQSKQPDRYRKTVAELNDLADSVVARHRKLIKACKKRLRT